MPAKENYDKLDRIADALEPLARIIGDEELKKHWKREPMIASIARSIRTHKDDLLRVLAAVDGVSYEAYTLSVIRLTRRLVDLMKDPELPGLISDLFTLQDQIDVDAFSGPATEATREDGK